MSVEHLTGLWSKKALPIWDKKDDMVFTFCSCVEQLFENNSGSWILATGTFTSHPKGLISSIVNTFYTFKLWKTLHKQNCAECKRNVRFKTHYSKIIITNPLPKRLLSSLEKRGINNLYVATTVETYKWRHSLKRKSTGFFKTCAMLTLWAIICFVKSFSCSFELLIHSQQVFDSSEFARVLSN